MLLYHFFDLMRRYNAGLSPLDFAGFEQHERRYTADLIKLCCLRVFIHIHLDYRKGIAHFLFNLFQNRRHHAAWSTPDRRKIHQRGFIGTNDLRKTCHLIVLIGLLRILPGFHRMNRFEMASVQVHNPERHNIRYS